jgi:hypothetical protein
VIGTENKEILILNPAGSTTLVRCRLKDVPAFMAVSGSALLCSALLCSALL